MKNKHSRWSITLFHPHSKNDSWARSHVRCDRDARTFIVNYRGQVENSFDAILCALAPRSLFYYTAVQRSIASSYFIILSTPEGETVASAREKEQRWRKTRFSAVLQANAALAASTLCGACSSPVCM